jgi:hypothetical protein
LVVLNVKSIESVVAMVPHSTAFLGEGWADRFFVVERPGLDVAVIAGVTELIPDE